MVRTLNLKMGLEKVSKPMHPEQSSFVAGVNAQMRALRDDLQSIMEQFEDVTPEITIEALTPTFDKSQIYCPHRTGDLRNSGYLESVGFRGQPRVELGYGRGGNPWYAALVHEQVEVPHAPPTRSKFLEAAVNEDHEMIFARVSEGYKRFMGV